MWHLLYISCLHVCPSGMEAGLHGLHGASAAAAAESVLKWGSGPATTPPLAMVVEYALARVEKRGDKIVFI